MKEASLDQTADERVRISTGKLVVAGASAIVAAIIVNLAMYLVSDAFGAIPDDLPAGAEQFGIPAIVIVAALTVTLATLALGLFGRFSQQPIRNFRVLAIIVLATSLSGPVGIEQAPVGLFVTMIVMHLATAAIAYVVLTRFAPAD